MAGKEDPQINTVNKAMINAFFVKIPSPYPITQSQEYHGKRIGAI